MNPAALEESMRASVREGVSNALAQVAYSSGLHHPLAGDILVTIDKVALLDANGIEEDIPAFDVIDGGLVQ